MDILPSEVARLVLGYLKQEKCDEAYEKFLYSSDHLGECRQRVKLGRSFTTKIMGKTLVEILDEYCQLTNNANETEMEKKSPSLIDPKTMTLRVTLPTSSSKPKRGEKHHKLKSEIETTPLTSLPGFDTHSKISNLDDQNAEAVKSIMEVTTATQIIEADSNTQEDSSQPTHPPIATRNPVVPKPIGNWDNVKEMFGEVTPKKRARSLSESDVSPNEKQVKSETKTPKPKRKRYTQEVSKRVTRSTTKNAVPVESDSETSTPPLDIWINRNRPPRYKRKCNATNILDESVKPEVLVMETKMIPIIEETHKVTQVTSEEIAKVTIIEQTPKETEDSIIEEPPKVKDIEETSKKTNIGEIPKVIEEANEVVTSTENQKQRSPENRRYSPSPNSAVEFLKGIHLMPKVVENEGPEFDCMTLDSEFVFEFNTESKTRPIEVPESFAEYKMEYELEDAVQLLKVTPFIELFSTNSQFDTILSLCSPKAEQDKQEESNKKKIAPKKLLNNFNIDMILLKLHGPH